MRKQKHVYEHKSSAKEYLLALASFPNYLKLLPTENKPYGQLIFWLISISDQIDDNNFSLPTMKDLAKEFKVDASKITKQLKMIYEDIIDLNHNQPNLFKGENQIQCCLSFNYLGAKEYFNTGLDSLPTIGNYFQFYFMRPRLGGTGFYANQIYHDLYSTGHSITISFNCRSENMYLSLLKEKALLHRRISFSEAIDDDMDDELKERLVKWSEAI
jgi:hypothetical protein